ncbi:hypothetical protein ACFPM0_35445 [Pseudonocardia sulfidoxydans]|uniref:hypothetical protein n=1 Tax=Pseudonocardia sulfidoxydans TaxID=54011 RepID=UPI00361BA60B
MSGDSRYSDYRHSRPRRRAWHQPAARLAPSTRSAETNRSAAGAKQHSRRSRRAAAGVSPTSGPGRVDRERSQSVVELGGGRGIVAGAHCNVPA